MNSTTGFRHYAFTGKRKALTLGVALALSAGTAQAAVNACYSFTPAGTVGNFTMIDPAGGLVGGTNDVQFTWDGTLADSVAASGQVSNAGIASDEPFNGVSWTAHDVMLYGPGVYKIYDNCAAGSPGCGTGNEVAFTVGANQIGAHMLFQWGPSDNIDVVLVLNKNATWTATNGAVAFAPFHAGADNGTSGTGVPNGTANTANTTFTLVSTDWNNDGKVGASMTDGPFAGFNANFNLQGTMTPLPGDPCAPQFDTDPDPFSFTDATGAAFSTPTESDAITVSGLGVSQAVPDSSQTAPIAITGNAGQYSVSSNSGTTWSPYSTTTPATVSNGDLVKVRQTSAATEDGATTNTTLTIGTVSDTFSVTTADKKPDSFSFTDQIGVATSTPVESNAIAISGMGASLSTPISISGGTYSINGGASTNVDGTVVNGDTVRVQQTSAATGATTTIATLTLGAAGNGTLVSGTFTVVTAGGATKSSTGNNFTMLDNSGGVTGGTNDVAMFWDGNFNTSASDSVMPATAHMRLTTNTPFFGFNWVAHHIRVFQPGTYTIDTTCTTAQLEAGTAVCNNLPLPVGQTEQFYTFTVGANQIGAHMLFDWGKDSATTCGKASCNIDVVDIWNQNAVFGPSTLYTGAVGFNAESTSWSLMSSDWDGDGQNGAAMIDGPFMGFKANFNLNFTGTLTPTNYTPTVNVDDPSDAKGCSISTKPVNGMERGDWWLVAGFLAWLGAFRLRFKRQVRS